MNIGCIGFILFYSILFITNSLPVYRFRIRRHPEVASRLACNGLNPRVSYKIYQCYVLPRLLYGLEVLPLTVSQINVLSKFHLDNLKRFQSLPVRVATCAVYLLLGALPIEAEIHKRQFSLLYNVLTSTNETVIELADRQIAVNLDNNLSYFSRIQEILQLYQLPSIDTLRDSLTTKDRWRYQFKTAVYNYWTVTSPTYTQTEAGMKVSMIVYTSCKYWI